MGKIIEVDDGLPAEEVGPWAKEKHEYLCRYIDISRAVRQKWLGDKNAGATFIDLFCGPGRCQIRGTKEWIDGGVIAAWKKSVEGGAPFSQIYIADLDEVRRKAAVSRLKNLEAPVIELEGAAVDAVKEIFRLLNPYGLHFAFLDPFNLEALDFNIIQQLSELRRIDMLVHVNQMDLQRNLVTNAMSANSVFDAFAPNWRYHVNIEQPQHEIRQQIFRYWRKLVEDLGVWPSTEMRLIRGGKNQPLYWLLLAAKHDLAHKFWVTASDVERQGTLDLW